MSKQLLSLALDDAASDTEWAALLAAMDADPSLKTAWSSAHAQRDARAGVAVHKLPMDFASSVMQAIAQEAPVASNVVPLRPPAAVITAPTAVRKARWQVLVPAFAVAAAIAGAFMVSGPLKQILAPEAPAVTVATTTGLPVTQVAWQSVEGSEPPDAASAQVLNDYLLEHSHVAVDPGMGGSISGARFAARTANFRPNGE